MEWLAYFVGFTQVSNNAGQLMSVLGVKRWEGEQDIWEATVESEESVTKTMLADAGTVILIDTQQQQVYDQFASQLADNFRNAAATAPTVCATSIGRGPGPCAVSVSQPASPDQISHWAPSVESPPDLCGLGRPVAVRDGAAPIG